jgi:hypothetical protein
VVAPIALRDEDVAGGERPTRVLLVGAVFDAPAKHGAAHRVDPRNKLFRVLVYENRVEVARVRAEVLRVYEHARGNVETDVDLGAGR